MEVECPYCSKRCDVQGLQNHVRLSDGNGHGEVGTVPDGDGGDGDPGEPPVSAVNSYAVSLEERIEDVREELEEVRTTVAFMAGEAAVDAPEWTALEASPGSDESEG